MATMELWPETERHGRKNRRQVIGLVFLRKARCSLCAALHRLGCLSRRPHACCIPRSAKRTADSMYRQPRAWPPWSPSACRWSWQRGPRRARARRKAETQEAMYMYRYPQSHRATDPDIPKIKKNKKNKNPKSKKTNFAASFRRCQKFGIFGFLDVWMFVFVGVLEFWTLGFFDICILHP